MRHLHFGLLVVLTLAASCQAPTYQDSLPPEDYFDPDIPPCVPKSCVAQGLLCGTTTDGCGATLNCGGCAAPTTCGGGGTAGICGCTPTRACEADVDCSSIADGCGATLDCGGCPEGKTCGANGAAGKCGEGTCTPETDTEFCARLSKNCGEVTAGDNCGTTRTVASCGTCTAPLTCGAAGICSCLPESDQAFCSRLGRTCGTYANVDNCGAPRTARCGSCAGSGSQSGDGGQIAPKADTGWTPWTPPDTGVVNPGPDAGQDPGPDAGPAVCPEAQRLCGHTFSYQGNGSEKSVVVKGTFDIWGTGVALVKGASNLWSADVPLAWNTKVLYKLLVDGTKWMADPANPKTENDGMGGVNSVLDPGTCAVWTCKGGPTTCTAASCTGETPSCNATSGACECTANSCGSGKQCSPSSKTCIAAPNGPALQLEAMPTVGADSYSFKVVYTPHSSGDALDLAASTITLNGAAATVPYDAATRTFTVSATGAAKGKYGYLFRVKDAGGRPSTLFVPFWVEASAFTWKDAFLYQIMTDRFVNGDHANDATVGTTDFATEWQGGDFKGVQSKLDYLEAMGVNTVWLSSPVSSTNAAEWGKGENTGHTMSAFHGYWPIATGWTNETPITGITAIEKRFGTAAELKALVNAAHGRGMRVLIDFVPNHVHSDGQLFKDHGSDSSWFNLSPKQICGVDADWDKRPENQTCWFDPFLPDLNTQNSTVNDTVAKHAVWLAQEFNLDGFRVDASKHVHADVLVAMRSRIKAEVSTTGLHFYMVGESLGSIEWMVKDCMGPTKLDGSVNDPLHFAILNTFLKRSASGNDLENAVRYDEYTWTNGYPEALMGHFMGSHDTARAISFADGNEGSPWSNQPGVPGSFKPFGRLRLAQAFLLTYNSIPIIWMGDEYGQPGSRDPDCRRMMKFDNDLTQLQKDTLAHAQKLGKARLAHQALRRGSRSTLSAENEFYAYGRKDGSDVVVAAFNLSEGSATKTLDVGSLGLTGTVTDVLSGKTFNVSGNSLTVTIDGLNAVVLTK
ncbi:MAG: alpha-amylase family glycosyl hydrolase [Myxococcales bacterium]